MEFVMNKFIKASTILSAAFVAASSMAYAQHSSTSAPHMAHSTAASLDPFPMPGPGMTRFVINLPAQVNETDFRVAITAGKTQVTDGVNQVRLGGTFEEGTVQGWGYNFYEYTGYTGNSMTTLMAPRPGRPPVNEFVSGEEKLVRYNSRLPLVVYAPKGLEVRYRVFQAGELMTASIDNAQAPTTGEMPPHQSTLVQHLDLSVDKYAKLPEGSEITVRLYDHLLMDMDSTYDVETRPIKSLPATVPMPVAKPFGRVAGPAVSVSVRDANGKLLYINDVVTPITDEHHIKIWLKSVQQASADSYIGKTVEQARAVADAQGVPFRIVKRDGQFLPATRDFRPGRINAAVRGGRVVSYDVEGR